MYEHVICINPLNFTLRSSTPDFFTRLGFEGTLTSEFARSQGGRRGSDPVLHQSYGLETFLISLSSLLGRNAPKKAKKQFYRLVISWWHKARPPKQFVSFLKLVRHFWHFLVSFLKLVRLLFDISLHIYVFPTHNAWSWQLICEMSW